MAADGHDVWLLASVTGCQGQNGEPVSLDELLAKAALHTFSAVGLAMVCKEQSIHMEIMDLQIPKTC